MHVHPILHDLTRLRPLLISFRILNLLSRVRTNTPSLRTARTATRNPPNPIMTRNNNRFIPVQGSFLRYHLRTPSSPRRDRLTRCHPPSRSESSPALKPPLFSISRMSRPSTAQEPLSGSTTHGSGRVERWIDDQRGEDQDPRRLSPMPRHSDTIVHSRRLNTPVKPRTPVSHRDGSDFVFVDDDDDDVSECTKSPDGDMCSNQVRVSVLPPSDVSNQVPSRNERDQGSPSRGGRTSGLFGGTSSPLKGWRMSFAPSMRRSSTGSHSRGSSLPTFNTSSTPNTPEKSDGTKRSTSPWKARFQRPSVKGHFASISESEAVKSRPSFGSTDSYPPSRPSIDAGGSLNTTGTQNSILLSAGFAKSSQSLWSLPPSATHIHDPPGSTKLVSQPSKSTIRVPFTLKPSSNNLSGSPPSLIGATRRRPKRKRLVIGGIPLNDHRRYEAAKRWCEVGRFLPPPFHERFSHPRPCF